MDPASSSSSSDDGGGGGLGVGSSSAAPSPSYGGVLRAPGGRDRRGRLGDVERYDGSSTSSSSESESELESSNGGGVARGPPPVSFNDLPSDDSVDIPPSDDGVDPGGSDDGSGGDDDGDDDDDDSADGEEGAALGDVLRERREGGLAERGGAPFGGGKAEAKRRALAVASRRLAALRKRGGRGGGGGGGASASSSRGTKGDGGFSDPFFGGGGGPSSSDGDGPEEAVISKKLGGPPKGAGRKEKRSRHHPTEASSRRSDHYARGAPDLNSSGIGVSVGANRYRPRDPRMQSLSGRHDAELFERRYGFLEGMREGEIAKLKERIAARRRTGRRGQKVRRRMGLTGPGAGSLEEDQAELSRLTQELTNWRRDRAEREAKAAVKRRLREGVAKGERGAYYLKRGERRRLELEGRFDELRKRGGDAAVDRAIAKRRKKTLARDKRFIPRAG